MAQAKEQQSTAAPVAQYEREDVEKFINHVMMQGKKTIARKIVFGALDIVKQKTGRDPLEVFEKAMENVAPIVEVRSRRVGGATYQVPVEVKGERQRSLATRWILNTARSKKGQPMKQKLAEELIAAANKEGSAYKKREDTHRMAEANRAFAHLAR